MAEFQVVMKQWKRMCDFYCRCVDCPMHEPNGCINPTHSEWNVAAEHIEHTVMSWAAEHLVGYPTWLEWLKSMGVIPYMMSMVVGRDDEGNFIHGHVDIKENALKPIPADIAEKLGIEPKEG